MATVTSCPRCSEKLRLPDELRGRQVRCPQCSNIFEATDSPPPAAAGADVPLNLSLDDPTPGAQPSAPAGPSPRSQPVGAIEIDLSLDDKGPRSESAPPRPRPEPPSERSDRPRDRGRERGRERERDDTRCPVCDRSNDPDARRCYHCGERLRGGPARSRYPDRDDYDDDYGHRRRRRDSEPHRAGVVLAMGIISLVGMALIAGVPIIFGIIGWVMGRTDLRKMRNNQMDPDGHGTTMAGYVCSIIGTLLNGAVLLLCCGFIGLMIYGESWNAPRTTRTMAPITITIKQPPLNKDRNQKMQPQPGKEKQPGDLPGGK